MEDVEPHGPTKGPAQIAVKSKYTQTGRHEIDLATGEVNGVLAFP